jgi:hypothetical protein
VEEEVKQEEILEPEENLELEPEGEQETPELELEGEQELEPEVEKAKKYGHISKEDWVAQGRNPNEWKSPKEFNKTGDVIEQVLSLKKQIEQRDRELKSVIEYQQRTSQREYERAKKELEAQLTHSKNDMDVEGVAHYTQELVRLEDREQQNHLQLQQQQQQRAIESFTERNQHWFNDRNPDLRDRAVEIDNEIKADINAGRLRVNSLDEIAQMIEKRMGYEYPDRVLGATRGQRPPSVSPSQSSVNKSAANTNSVSKTFKGLSQGHKDTYNVYKRMNPNITEAEFINRLKKDGEI